MEKKLTTKKLPIALIITYSITNNLAGENLIGGKFCHRTNVPSLFIDKACTREIYFKLLH